MVGQRMSHLVWYTYSMIIKTDMKENNKANNLQEGRIYINATTGEPMRLISIIPCQGVWMETYDGQGYGDLIEFEDVHYASDDEVQDYLEDYRVYTANEKADSHKEQPSIDIGVRLNYDKLWNVQGYYNDDEGNDIRCRD